MLQTFTEMERQASSAVIIVNMSGFCLNKQLSFVYSVKKKKLYKLQGLQNIWSLRSLMLTEVKTASPGMIF